MTRHWLINRKIDLLGLFIPVWVAWLVLLAVVIPFMDIQADVPVWVWAVLILGIDVSHVWSTLFRTYGDPSEFRQHKVLLTVLPLVLFLAGLALAWWSEQWFWRILAYVAVFHFIKQQYGFTALYRAGEKRRTRKVLMSDKFIIYWATLYPVLYWHLTPDVHFHWFVEGDFLPLSDWLSSEGPWLPEALAFFNVFYWVIIGAWCFQEYRFSQWEPGSVSKGKVLWVLTTAWNWYGGIVVFNSDIIFTVSNVVAHGIPYVVLIWYYRREKVKLEPAQYPSFKAGRWIVVLITSIVLFAFMEEYLWDMLIWRDHQVFFESLFAFPIERLDTRISHAIGLTLLSLPQTMHYVIDGFIWKVNHRNPHMYPIFIKRNEEA